MSLSLVAPPYLGQLFFRTRIGNGFSETYWVKGTSYNSAMVNLLALVPLRAAMFTDQYEIVYARVSDSTKKRDTQVIAPNAVGTYEPDAQDMSPDDTALLQRFEGIHDETPYFILKPLHLIPEECVTNGKYVPTAQFLAAIIAFHDAVQLKCQIVVRTGDPPTTRALDITAKLAQRITRRKVGRPFGLAAGRSRTP